MKLFSVHIGRIHMTKILQVWTLGSSITMDFITTDGQVCGKLHEVSGFEKVLAGGPGRRGGSPDRTAAWIAACSKQSGR